MKSSVVPRWIRSLQAQLFLWAVLPVTFAIISLAFTGVYAHQQTMRDFAAERDLTDEDILAEIEETVPLSVTYKEYIDSLREWASTRARAAS